MSNKQLARRLHQSKLLLELPWIRLARTRVPHYLHVMVLPNEKK
jgi:hypothetical protein